MLKGGAGRLWTSGKTGGMGRRVQKGALGVEHTIKGSGGDFLMVLKFFFVWNVVLAAHVYHRYTGTEWGHRYQGQAVPQLHSLRENSCLSPHFSDFPGSKILDGPSRTNPLEDLGLRRSS